MPLLLGSFLLKNPHKSDNMGSSQDEVENYLKEHESVTAGKIAKDLGKSISSVSLALSRLKRWGIVEFEKDLDTGIKKIWSLNKS